jgi:hypothetical protein
MPTQRKGGAIALQVAGVVYQAKGEATYNLGGETRQAVVGQDGIHGYAVQYVVPYIEVTITDDAALDLAALKAVRDVPVALTLANGKVILLSDAWAAGDWEASSGEGEIQARFEARFAEEVLA